MTIVSASLTDDNIRTLDEITAHYGLKGRSEAIRHSIKAADTEMKEMSEISGHVEGVLIVVHGDHSDLNSIQHRYESQIKTQLHSHLMDKKCLDIMIISSDSDTMKSMVGDIYSTGKADYIKFVRG